MSDRRTPESVLDVALAAWARRRLVAVAVFLTVLAGGLSVAVSLPSVYRSTATVLIERQDVRDALVRPGLPTELEARLHTIGQEALSRGRLEALMVRFGLYPTQRARQTSDAAVEQFRRDIGVALTSAADATAGRGTIAFRVNFRGRDPEVVAQVANSLAEFYVEENLKIRERQARGAARLLARHGAEATQRLDEQERRIAEFKRRHMGELPEQVTANLATLERLNAQLALNNSNQARVLERRAALARQLAGLEVAAPVPGREGAPARLTRLKHELVRLRLQYKDTYPDVAQLKAEIAALEAQSAPAAAPEEPPGSGIARGLAEADAELGRLGGEEQRLRREIERYQRRVEAAPEREQEIQRMSRDYRTTKDQYDTTVKRYQDALIAEDVAHGRTGDEFRILDPAIPERVPVAPNRARLGLMAALLALGAAAAAVVLVESLDTSFHGLADLRAFTSVPVVAAIPRLAAAGDTARARTGRWLVLSGIVAGVVMVSLVCHHVARGNEQLVWILSRAS